ncbi:MAG: aconitate hydratase [Candidatus Altiarchaeota archaeon]
MASVAEKILGEHLVEGAMESGSEIGVVIDQTLTQDATGTLAYLQFEAMGIPKVKTRLSVSYVDHNTLQTDYRNADDHRFLQTFAAKYGILFSRPGNGVCHQIHLERFAKPGETLLGSDSHTPTSGGMGMIAIGAGGLDVAVAMGGGPFYTSMPEIVGVKLDGVLNDWCSAKDAILDILMRLGVKGGVGKIFEYHGPGVGNLSVPERATITNMGAELGATTSIFPSDDITRGFLEKQGRASDWTRLEADGEEYSENIELYLDSVEPLIAQPHSPDAVTKVADIQGMKVDQVCIGSCTNSSLKDLMTAARMLEGGTIHPDVSFTVSPGSRQVYETLAREGGLATLIKAGARILEPACGPCIGMGQSPNSGGISIRTFNRNFEGRSGTADAKVYLSSVEVAVASALKGELTDPRTLGKPPEIRLPDFVVEDGMIIKPPSDTSVIRVLRGPNIKPLPLGREMEDDFNGFVLLKTGDNVTTDHIMPAGSKILPLRSNIPAISEYVFTRVDESFPMRAKESGGGFIVGGANYGQGSSREHAALAPMYLGVKAVIAKSFARIHKSNLINFGILPLEFADDKYYDGVEQDDILDFDDMRSKICEKEFTVKNKTKKREIIVRNDYSKRQVQILLAGGLLNHTKNRS